MERPEKVLCPFCGRAIDMLLEDGYVFESHTVHLNRRFGTVDVLDPGESDYVGDVVYRCPRCYAIIARDPLAAKRFLMFGRPAVGGESQSSPSEAVSADA